MTDQNMEIKWEWPANRKVETKLLVDVIKISKSSTGFFGIGASPSLGNALPEATDIIASVISGQEKLIGKTLTIRIPGVEATKLKAGKPAAIGLISSNRICICVSAIPTSEGVDDWLKKWHCD